MLSLVEDYPYGSKPAFERQWIYSDADIDGAKKRMGVRHGSKGESRIDCAKDRCAWRLEIGRYNVLVKLNSFSMQRRRF